MRGAGMLRVTTGTMCLLVLTIGRACGFPLQILPSIPGYIPVYIRNGDQPLIEINPALAEAFQQSENYSKTVQNMQLDRVPDQQNPDKNRNTSFSNEGPTSEEIVSENLGNVVPSKVVDSKNNYDINKIVDPQFLNVYELKENKDEDVKSNIMKISNIQRIPKDGVKKLTLTEGKEDTRSNNLENINSKVSIEPEDVQFIKVSIMSDPLDIPVVQQAKNVRP